MEFFTGGLIKSKFNSTFNRLVADMIGKRYQSMSGNTQITFEDNKITRSIVKDLKNTISLMNPHDVSQDTIDRLITNYLSIQEENNKFGDSQEDKIDNLPAIYSKENLDTILENIFSGSSDLTKESEQQSQLSPNLFMHDVMTNNENIKTFSKNESINDANILNGNSTANTIENKNNNMNFNNESKTFENDITNPEPNYGILKNLLIKLGRNFENIGNTSGFNKLINGEYDNVNSSFLKYYMSENLFKDFIKEKGNLSISNFLNSERGSKWRNILRGKDILSEEFVRENLLNELNKMPGYSQMANLLLKEVKNGKLLKSYLKFSINQKDLNKVTNEYNSVAAIVRSILPDDKRTSFADKIISDLASSDKSKIDEALKTIVNEMLTNDRSFFSKTHLSYAGVVEFMINSAERIQSVMLDPNSTLYNDNTLAMHYINPESKPRTIKIEKYDGIPGNLNVLSPKLYQFVRSVIGLDKDTINLGSMISTLSNYLDNVDRMMKSEFDKVVITFDSHVDSAIKKWKMTFNSTLDESKTSVDIILGKLVSEEIDNLDIPNDLKPTFHEIQKIMKNQDLLMANILSKSGKGYIEDYTNQGLIRDGLISTFNELTKTNNVTSSLYKMCHDIYPHLDVDTMSIKHFKNKISELPKDKMEKGLKLIENYEKTGVLDEKIPRFSIDNLKYSIENILSDNGKMFGKSNNVQKFGERVFFYKSFDDQKQVFVNLGIFESNYNILSRTLLKQIRSRHKYKYLTLISDDQEHSILDEIYKLHDVVKSAINLNRDDYEREMNIGKYRKKNRLIKFNESLHKIYLSKAFSSLKYKADYLKGASFVPPIKPPNKTMDILGNLFFGSALSGMPLTSIANDAITTSLMFSDTFKEAVNYGMTYAKVLTENLNEEELKIAGSVLPFDTIDHSQSTLGERNFRKYGTLLYSNEIISHDGKRAATLVGNKVLAKDFIGDTRKSWDKLDNLVGFKDDELYEYIKKHKENLIIKQDDDTHLILTHLMNDEMRYRLEGRLSSFVDILIPEQDTVGSSLKFAADRLPYISFIVKSLLMFKSPSITELNNSIRIVDRLLDSDPKFVMKYFGVSLIQSVIYNYLKVKGRGGDVEDFQKFLMNAIIQSPLTGVLGEPISKILDRDIGGFIDANIKHPIVPLIKGVSSVAHDLSTGNLNAATYDLFRGMNSYNLIRNFPVLSGIWRRYFLENMYDYLYPDNRSKENLNNFSNRIGVNYD
ncbi:MAG: hypothetical protein ACRCX2_01120 [Paraclostridium sp.]